MLLDLTVLGKIVGGGLPLAAFEAGRRSCGNLLLPARSTRPGRRPEILATAAGLSVLRRLQTPRSTTSSNAEGPASKRGCRRRAVRASRRNGDVVRRRHEQYAALFRHLLEQDLRGPSQFEAMFLSLAHGDDEIDRTIEAVADFGQRGLRRSPRARGGELEPVFSPLAQGRFGVGSRRSTRATSSTTDGRVGTLRWTATRHSCSATTSTRRVSPASRRSATSTPSSISPS